MATTVPNNPFDVSQSSSSGGGIVGGAIQDMGTPKPQTYTAQERSVDRATETAAGQMDSLLAKDSPLMQRARTLAKQGMNQRGLVNSSMAQGAGVAAMIDRATPLAQQDAQIYSNRSLANQQAVNEANQFNVGEGNKLYGQKQAMEFQTAERLGAQDFAAGQTKAQQDFSAAQSALDRAQQTALADKSIEAQQALQVAQQNFQGAQNALDRSQQTSLQQGQQTFTAQQAALDRTQQTSLQTLQQNFQSAQAALDRAQQVALADKSIAAQIALQNAQQNFQGAQAELDRRLQTSLQLGQQEFQASQQSIQNDFNMRMQQLQESGQDFRQARDIASREAMQKFEQMGIQNRFDQELALKDKQFNVEQYNLERRQILSNQNELDKLGLQIKATQAQVPTNFAATISNSAMAGVNAVYAQPMDANGKPTAAERQAQAQSIVNYANSQISWAEKMYSTTIPRVSL